MRLYDNDSYRDEFMNGVYALLSNDGTNDRANQIIDLFDLAPEVEATIESPNAPLTLAELREMDGDPVYIVHNERGRGWCIVDWHGVNKSWLYFSKTGTAEGMTAIPVSASEYSYTWFAYRRKPEEGSL